MKKLIVSVASLTCLVAFINSLQAQRIGAVKAEYAISNLPDSMKINADAVIREEDETVTFTDKAHFNRKNHQVTTILNENAVAYKFFHENYTNNFNSIRKISGYLYDTKGTLIEKLETSDIHDMGMFPSAMTLVEDSRIKVGGFKNAKIPCTVEFYYEEDDDQTLFLPQWYFQSLRIASVKSIFTVISPKDLVLAYRCVGIKEPLVTEDGKNKTWVWSNENEKAVRPEPASPSSDKYLKQVSLTLDQFEVYKTSGSLASWASLAAWAEALYDGRDELTPEVQQVVNRIVASAHSQHEIVENLYHYLQDNTRYVSIQLGVGGWQPIPAKFTCSRGYGDCKGLANYMKAMLKYAHIDAYPAIIRSGVDEEDIDTAFIASKFDHVILFVPLKEESIWLDCTSKNNPFGHLGAFTENRHALVLRGAASGLIPTPVTTMNDNGSVRQVDVILDANGEATLQATAKYKGYLADEVRMYLGDATSLGKEEWLRKKYTLPECEVKQLQFSTLSYSDLYPEMKVKLAIPSLTIRAGKRLVLNPNVMMRWHRHFDEVKNRTQPVKFEYPFTENDSVVYHLPESFRIDHLPNPIKINTDFGIYSAELTFDHETHTLVYRRRLNYLKNRFPKEAYPAFRQFFLDVMHADNMQVALLSET